MTCEQLISLIKNYEEQTKNYILYMEKIRITLISNPAYVSNIKLRIINDERLQNRIYKLANSMNGNFFIDLFPEMFLEENDVKKRR